LRQSLTQHLEAATAVAGTRHDHPAIDRDAPLIFDRRDKPGGIRVTRMGGDGKAEFRWTDRRQLIPIGSGVLRPEDAIVVLAPDDFRACGTARQKMDVQVVLDICAAKARQLCANVVQLRSAVEAIARRKSATLAQLAIAWPMAQGARAGFFIAPIPGAKSRKHIEENVRAADIVFTADDFEEIDRMVPHGAASGTRYPTGQMHRLNR
jgi:hypothetical protein